MIPRSPNHNIEPLASHAHACVAAGLCVLPAVRRDNEKRPALQSWKPYQSRRPTIEEIRGWFGPNISAMCLVCGAVSGNLEAIDFDLGGEMFEPWRRAVDIVAPGLVDRLFVELTPSGGRHVFYRSEAAVSGNVKLARRIMSVDDDTPVVVGGKKIVPRRAAGGAWTVESTTIETRGEGGLCLCAPSDGYFVQHGDLLGLPVLTVDERDLLLGCARALDDSRPPVLGREARLGRPAEAFRPGDDFNDRGDPRRFLIAHGWALEKTADVDGNQHWRRPGKAVGTSATLKDGVFYVFSTNAAPFDACTGYSPFAVYTFLEHAGDWSAAASALAAQGFGRPGNSCSVRLPAPTSDGPSPTQAPCLPSPLSASQLVGAHPQLRPPVIHGLLREGETMNIIAAPKTGKSWLALDLALAVATGCLWLGRYPTVRGRVLIIDNELHPETSAQRIPMVADARGIKMDQIADRVFIDNLRGRLQDIFKLEPYFAALEPGHFKVIVLDALYRFMPSGSDENDNGTMAEIYSFLDGVAHRLGCCFVLVHHSTKGSQSAKSVTDIGAGAGAQSRATDTHLVLRPHAEEGVAVLEAAVRSWAPVQPVGLRWSFPVWTVDDSLAPKPAKGDRSEKRHGQGQGRRPQVDEWSPERFAKEFFNATPLARKALLARTSEHAELSGRHTEELLALAEQRRLIERVRISGRGGRDGFVIASAEGAT